MKLSEVIKIDKKADTPEESLNITRDRAIEIFYEVDSMKGEAESYKDLILKSMSLNDKIEESILALMYACFIFGKGIGKKERMEEWIQKQTKNVFLGLREQ